MRKYFILTGLILLIGVLFYVIYLPVSLTGESKEALFVVEKGEGSRDIALNLEKQRLIRWGPVFRIYVLTFGMSEKLQAGTYLLSPLMNIPQIAEKLVEGEVAKEKITIIEGWNLKDIGFYFENKGMFQAEELYDEMAELEGYLFPDTYWVMKDESLEDIVQRMKDNFEEKTKNLEITPGVVVMASLLERELQTKDDKEVASGILWKRLQIGMPLQVDVEMWTYENLGLPPKPICNPGLESIKAAIYPKESVYWYYLSTPEGETIFSKTLEDHNIAKAFYLK
ncbi:MAG: endolytic transglycosylase MltG [bacterium]